MSNAACGPLWQRLVEAPAFGEPTRIAGHVAELKKGWDSNGLAPELQALADKPEVAEFLGATIEGSGHLAMLLRRDGERALRVLAAPPEDHLQALISACHELARSGHTHKSFMKRIRELKAEATLVIALSDLGGVWPIMHVTDALSRFADASCESAVSFLFSEAERRGDWLADANAPAQSANNSGYFVLAMGKHGARELNYSSDIDLIVFFEPDKCRLKEGLEPQQFYVKLTRDFVQLLSERTPDGYVFRTDLRLRPDPGATHAAMSTAAALQYYESVGQNWERAAMIKARPVAGDMSTARAFLAELSPFIWRKYLDYAAIADIHAMKRQINAHRGLGNVQIAGHNIKLGRGGIREIEFFTQTQQLIAGGRQPELRVSQTLNALSQLAARGWIERTICDQMADAYRYLRRLEHRIQMVADEQTHALPKNEEALVSLAHFSGYRDFDDFTRELRHNLNCVQDHYAALFEDAPQLALTTANLVLTGEEDDPDTIEALAGMGFRQPSQVLAAVRAWHRGRYPAVSSEGGRARLTEVQPLLIDALSKTVNPDAALAGFDAFLKNLPAGIQLFALLKANPELMRLVALIMGSAPRLAAILSRRRRVIDAVLDPRIIGTMPTPGELAQIITTELSASTSYEETLDRARVVGREQMFLAGVRLLTGIISAAEAEQAYSAIAEELVRQLHAAVEQEVAVQHGRVPGGASCIVAMGRLGGREMTATSDLDLIVIYDFASDAKMSDGPKSLAVSQYYARLTQRLISAISALTSEGRLYEVDMRLRPSGNKGPVATQLSSFKHYQAKEAWTWEHMALTRARVISGPAHLRAEIESAIRDTQRQPRDRARLVHDVRDMRERIFKEKGTEDPWSLKQVRGGLVDVEFLVQYLQLAFGPDQPELFHHNTIKALERAITAGLIKPATSEGLLRDVRLMATLSQLLRVTLEGEFEPASASDGLKSLLVNACAEADFDRLSAALREAQSHVRHHFDAIVALSEKTQI